MSDRTGLRGYRAELRQESDGSWTAEVPELAGSVAAGDTPDEAIAGLADAIGSWIEAAQVNDRVVPRPVDPDADYSGRFVLRLPKSLHRALVSTAAREGVSLNAYCQVELARAIGSAHSPWDEVEVLTRRGS